MKPIPLLLVPLLACAHAATKPESAPLQLPSEPPPTSTVLRAFVLGDAGKPGPNRAAVDDAIRARLATSTAPAVVLMPGDLFYPKGLPADCDAARARVENEYVKAFPDVPFEFVGGNHDHGDVSGEANPKLVARDSFFDCNLHSMLEPASSWPPTCECVAGWHDVTHANLAGFDDLGPVALVGYDSQEALVRPQEVAAAIGRALDEVPKCKPTLVMAHHFFESVGPHGAGEIRSASDLKSEPYQSYLHAVEHLLTSDSRVELLVFGHDHLEEFFPGEPAELVSGAGSKTSPVFTPAPAGDFAVGDSPGFAEVDVESGGALDVTVVTREAPRTFHVRPRECAVVLP